MEQEVNSQSISIHEDISIVLFISMTLFSFAEMFGMFTSALITLDYPFSMIIPIIMVFFGILGLLGVLTASRTNIMFALFATLTELGLLSVSLLINPIVPLLLPTITMQILLVAVLVVGGMTLLLPQQTREDFFITPSQKENHLAIEIRELKKIFDLGEGVKVNALQGVHLKIKRGDFVAIMGPSGSGKSTLLNCLGALDRPTEGKIFIDGVDISQLDNEGLAWLRNRKIGFIFQSYNLISRSFVGQNVEVPALVTSLGAKKRKEKAKRLLESVGLGDKYNRYPRTLSGGEQQRVAIARALMNDPTILLADEPTGNLDSKSGAVVMEILQKLNQDLGVTIVVVTHDPEVANLTNRIYFLKDGKNVGIKENVSI